MRFGSWWLVLVVVLVVVLGASLRLYQAGESLWLDELHTSWVVSDGFSVIADRAWIGNQSPLYFVITWLCVNLFGHNEWALRLPSLLAGIALVGLAGWTVQRWSGSAAIGLFVALLAACHRDLIFYSQEARPYALLQLGALLHGILFVELLCHPTRRLRLVFILGGAGLFYLHYTAFLFLVAELSFWIGWVLVARVGRRPAYPLSCCVIDALGMAILAMPSLPHLVEIAGRRDAWSRLITVWPSPALWHNLFYLALFPVGGVLVDGTLAVVIHGRQSKTGASGRPGWLGLCGNDLRGSLLHWIGPTRIPLFWTAFWFLIPMLVAFFSTLHGVAALWMVRYLAAALVGLLLFCGLCLTVIRSRCLQFVTAVAVFVGMTYTSGMVAQVLHDGRLLNDRCEDWRAAVCWLNSASRSDPLPVLLLPGLLEDLELGQTQDQALEEYCCFPLRGIYYLESELVEACPTTTRRQLPDEHVRSARKNGGVWVVVRSRPRSFDRFVRSVADSLSNGGRPFRVKQRREFGNVVIVRFEEQ